MLNRKRNTENEMTPEQAKAKAQEWHGQAGGEVLPQLTANELAGILQEEHDSIALQIDQIAGLALKEGQPTNVTVNQFIELARRLRGPATDRSHFAV